MEPVLIPAGAPMRLTLGKGSRIAAARGAIWLTVAGDQRDYVLHDGREYVAAGKAEVMVEALGGAAAFSLMQGARPPCNAVDQRREA
jgi:hypothetical protein